MPQPLESMDVVMHSLNHYSLRMTFSQPLKSIDVIMHSLNIGVYSCHNAYPQPFEVMGVVNTFSRSLESMDV